MRWHLCHRLPRINYPVCGRPFSHICTANARPDLKRTYQMKRVSRPAQSTSEESTIESFISSYPRQEVHAASLHDPDFFRQEERQNILETVRNWMNIFAPNVVAPFLVVRTLNTSLSKGHIPVPNLPQVSSM